MPRPQPENAVLASIKSRISESEAMRNRIKNEFSLAMLQKNVEITDACTVATVTIARNFVESIKIPEPLQKMVLAEVVSSPIFFLAVDQILKHLVETDKEAGNE